MTRFPDRTDRRVGVQPRAPPPGLLRCGFPAASGSGMSMRCGLATVFSAAIVLVACSERAGETGGNAAFAAVHAPGPVAGLPAAAPEPPSDPAPSGAFGLAGFFEDSRLPRTIGGGYRHYVQYRAANERVTALADEDLSSCAVQTAQKVAGEWRSRLYLDEDCDGRIDVSSAGENPGFGIASMFPAERLRSHLEAALQGVDLKTDKALRNVLFDGLMGLREHAALGYAITRDFPDYRRWIGAPGDRNRLHVSITRGTRRHDVFFAYEPVERNCSLAVTSPRPIELDKAFPLEPAMEPLRVTSTDAGCDGYVDFIALYDAADTARLYEISTMREEATSPAGQVAFKRIDDFYADFAEDYLVELVVGRLALEEIFAPAAQ